MSKRHLTAAVAILVLAGCDEEPESSGAATGSSAAAAEETATADVAEGGPARLVEIVEAARTAYAALPPGGETRVAGLSQLYANRDTALCALMEETGYAAEAWSGTFNNAFAVDPGTGQLDLQADKAAAPLLVSISVGPNLWVATGRLEVGGAAVEERLIDTLIAPGDPLHAKAAALTSGQPVTFSATFVENGPFQGKELSGTAPGDPKRCIVPTSADDYGQISQPSYWVRFTKLDD